MQSRLETDACLNVAHSPSNRSSETRIIDDAFLMDTSFTAAAALVSLAQVSSHERELIKASAIASLLSPSPDAPDESVTSAPTFPPPLASQTIAANGAHTRKVKRKRASEVQAPAMPDAHERNSVVRVMDNATLSDSAKRICSYSSECNKEAQTKGLCRSHGGGQR
jgi:hypothetical protein